MVTVMEDKEEMEKQIPSLTLDPFGSGAAQAAPAQAEVPAADTAAGLDDSALSEEEKKAVEEFSQKIDVTDSTAILQYGAAAQQKISAFSDSALESVKTQGLRGAGRHDRRAGNTAEGIFRRGRGKGILWIF